jgi:hypothetical protein
MKYLRLNLKQISSKMKKIRNAQSVSLNSKMETHCMRYNACINFTLVAWKIGQKDKTSAQFAASLLTWR